MADGLWDFENNDDSDDFSSSDDEPATGEQSAGKKRKHKDFDIEDMLPSEKRARLRKKYGDLKGDLPALHADAGNKVATKAAAEECDSDLEILREEEAAAQEKSSRERQQQQQKQKQSGQKPNTAKEWENRQLLARVKARLNHQNQKNGVEDDEEEEYKIEDSPQPANRGPPVAGILPLEELQSPPVPSPGQPINNAIVSVIIKDKNGEELEANVKRKRGLGKLFDAFKTTALAKGWLTPTTCLKFMFDGDVLTPTNTPEELDMDDGDVIEVHYS